VIADIASGHTAGADILFLVAAVLFVISAALAWSARALWPVLCALGLGCVAVGLLLL
jgi:hypothetical protein